MKELKNEMPIAKICIGKNEIKHYPYGSKETTETYEIFNKVYLKDKTEFQIELFNPTSDNIVCKFEINGKSESSEGLILHPGQRVFLDRYLDENKKFLFETYDVEANNETVNQAIRNNGLIKINFFKERIKTYQITTINTYPRWRNLIYHYTTDTPWVNYSSNGYNTTSSTLSNANSIDSTYHVKNASLGLSSTDNKKETGIIGKGNYSNQDFYYKDISYESFPFFSTTIKILPFSEKILDTKDIHAMRKYCPNCGKKVGKNDHFCSFCGKKL